MIYVNTTGCVSYTGQWRSQSSVERQYNSKQFNHPALSFIIDYKNLHIASSYMLETGASFIEREN
jgi:hypothetical protein